MAPEFVGIDYTNHKEASLLDFRGKVVILDFGYMACSPCNRAIPALNSLLNKFKDASVIALSINSHDNNENGEARLARFIENFEMKFPTILVNKEVDSLYLVKAYPTIYVIDEVGKIIYNHIGHSDKQLSQLTEFLESRD